MPFIGYRRICLKETVLPVLEPLLLDEPWIPGPTGFTAPTKSEGGWLLSPPINPLRTSDPLLPVNTN